MTLTDLLWPADGRRALRHLLSLALALLVVACGGGGVGGQGTGTFGFAEGSVTGFGSIIVNGVHYDESSARILDADGQVLDRSALRLGMTVQINSGGVDRNTLTAVASEVRVVSDLLGTVQSIDLAGSTFQVLDQTVRVTASTLFDPSLAGGLSVMSAGQVVEVYAILDPVTQVYAARLVRPRSGVDHYTLRGVVRNLNTDTRECTVGGAILVYAGALPEGLSNGMTLRMRLQTARDGSGRWVIAAAQDAATVPADGTEVEIEAVVSSYTSRSSFVVNGLTVNASGATIESSGVALASGVRVEVEGRMQGGVLVATKVEVKGSDDDAGGDDSGEGQEFELDGAISALDRTAQTFVIRGQTVSYAQASFDKGSAATLADGVTVEVKGVRSADGTVIVASEIKFDD